MHKKHRLDSLSKVVTATISVAAMAVGTTTTTTTTTIWETQYVPLPNL